jgi:hypothetical protein
MTISQRLDGRVALVTGDHAASAARSRARWRRKAPRSASGTRATTPRLRRRWPRSPRPAAAPCPSGVTSPSKPTSRTWSRKSPPRSVRSTFSSTTRVSPAMGRSCSSIRRSGARCRPSISTARTSARARSFGA